MANLSYTGMLTCIYEETIRYRMLQGVYRFFISKKTGNVFDCRITYDDRVIFKRTDLDREYNTSFEYFIKKYKPK